MTINASSASDSTYHARHANRSLRRAKCIADEITVGATVLDVGCNKGLTSQFLLTQAIASRVTGIELHASTVDNTLRQDPRFEMLEGSVAELDLRGVYDACIYGAVHHHILNLYGLSIAVETLQRLVGVTRRHLFFETGQVSEGGRWEWQNRIRRYFRTDEEHFFYLLKSIEHCFDDFAVIGQFRIHGARRFYLRIDLKPFEERDLAGPSVPRVPISGNVEKAFARSFGSRSQRLIELDDKDAADSPTDFSIVSAANNARYLIKRYRHHVSAACAEWQIGTQINRPWAIVALGLADTPDALVFPYIENAISVYGFRKARYEHRKTIAKKLIKVFDEAAKIPIALPGRTLLRLDKSSCLLEVCDLNPNNLLIVDTETGPGIYFIDFELQSKAYGPHNRLHLARMLWILKCYRPRALKEAFYGVSGMIIEMGRYQTRPFAIRVRDRQPSMTSFVVAEVRSRTGRAFRSLLRLAGQDS